MAKFTSRARIPNHALSREVLMSDLAIDFYRGSYAPPIRLRIDSAEALALLSDIFLRLASGEAAGFELHKSSSVAITGIGALTLALISGNKIESGKTLRHVREGASGPAFLWTRSKEGW